MTAVRAFVRGAGVGAIAMYFLDPECGPRRRALVADSLTHWTLLARSEVETELRDVAERLRGLSAAARRGLRGEPPPLDDEAVARRLRARLDTLDHPRAVEVAVEDGRVHLRGVVLRRDAERARRAVRHEPGARELVDELEVHDEPDLPVLREARGHAPATRLAIGTLTTVALSRLARRAGGTRLVRITSVGALAGAMWRLERADLREGRPGDGS